MHRCDLEHYSTFAQGQRCLVPWPNIDTKKLVFFGNAWVKESFANSLHSERAQNLVKDLVHHTVIKLQVVLPKEDRVLLHGDSVVLSLELCGEDKVVFNFESI